MSEPGFAYGAAVSWCADTNRDLDLGAALSVHAFDDPTRRPGVGAAADRRRAPAVTPQIPNHSILAMHLYFPQIRIGRGITTGITDDELASVANELSAARADVERAQPGRDDADLLSRRSPGRSICSSC